MKMKSPFLIVILAIVVAMAILTAAHAYNPITDVQQELKWTLGEQALLGTAYKVAGSGDFKTGKRGDSAMLGIFDYRFIKASYGVIRDSDSGSRVGDGFKLGLMANYFLGWFKSPQTDAMKVLSNVNIGPTVTVPLFSDSRPFTHPSVWVEANYLFGGK